jgi:carbon storage regulator
MLVLSRKTDQSLKLGPEITLTVLSIEGDRVKLGIEAPRTVSILRQELFEQLQAANTDAGVSSAELRKVAAALNGRPAEAVAP